MAFLKINQGYFDTERFVVAEEYRRGREQPYGKIVDDILPKLFPDHPYRWSPIGDMDELGQASADELQQFWNTYYVPNNAALVVVGDVEHRQIHDLAERYFGWIPRYPDPPRVTQEPAPQTARRVIKVKSDNGPAPVIALLYRTVAKGHADELPLEMLAQIVGQGESSRVYRDLVTDRDLAKFALSLAFTLEQDGMFALGAVLAPLGGDADEALAAMREHVERVKAEGVTAVELEKARNNMLRDAVAGQLTVESKAQLLGEAALIKGDLASVNRRFDAIRAVTNADLQRVAKQYLVEAAENEIQIEPSLLGFLSKGGDKEEAPEKPPESTEISGAGTGKPGLVRPAEFTTTPPVATERPAYAKLAPTEFQLANGLHVVLVPNREVPFVTMTLAVPFGAMYDPGDAPGTASMAASMLTRGTTSRGYAELADELDRYAISIAGSASMDAVIVNASAASDQRDRALELLADVATRPAFPEKELTELIGQAKTGMLIAHAAPEFQADREFRRRLFGPHPYARTAEGEAADLDKLTAPGLAQWWSDSVRPDNAVLYVAGDVDPTEMRAQVQRRFGSWARPEFEFARQGQPMLGALRGRHIYLVDRPSEQAQIRVGHQGVTRRDAAYIRARVTGEILGGGFNSRLNDRIRVKDGLTYGARGGFHANVALGSFEVSTFSKNATVGKTVAAILDELERLTREPPTARELRDVVGYLVGSFPGSRETPQDVVGDLWRLRLHGLEPDYYERYLAGIVAVTPTEVQHTAADLIDPDNLIIVVVGNAAELKPQLESIGTVHLIKD
jgi:zinc protease